VPPGATHSPFRPAPADVDLVKLESDELERWRAHRVFERSVAAREGAPRWVFYEGPPTANGRPGLHHVWARVFKDLFCRYRTMRGFFVERRAGWDTHGLPVEVEVEKLMGISSKRQIEEVGVDEFTRRCRESVRAYVDDWRALTERIGYWVDLDRAYWTFDSDYVQSVWWHLRQLFDQGLLYEDLKVVPYCPRCGTALSSHELGQPGVYQEVEDESAYVRFALTDPARHALGSARWLVVWTTTPWTLLANTGAAVNPGLRYAVVDGQVVASERVEAVFGEGAKVEGEVDGEALVGVRYERPFDDLAPPAGADGWRVVPGEFVTTDEGTGVVHLAPAFGEVDREVGRATGLPSLNPVGPDGRFTQAVSWLAGQPVRQANHEINDRLDEAGLLLRRHPYRHSYPHCWRCGTPLIYWGKPSWYVATSSRKGELVSENQGVDWHPGYIKEGRFGEWLSNNVDWALSRDRFWGTPLPVWRCGEGHLACVASLEELSGLAGRDVTGLDPHRPDIDTVRFPCPTCRREMSRVEPVIDAWFDSGSMPAAQVGYPHVAGSEESFLFPADFITEAIDQTRGWFYSLLAVNTLVFGSAPYRHVMCLGHIVDAEGRKMSKSLGNIIDPWEILTTRGADALRWWMYIQGSPWTATRVSMGSIDAAMRDSLLTLWHTFSFFTTYASLNGFDPDDPQIPAPAERPALDRWVLSRLATTALEMTRALDGYEPLEAATALASLIDDLSNWYVRRSRRRFWRTDPDAPPADSLGAHATLHTVLDTLTRLLAPLCPFMADHLYLALGGGESSASVHLEDWPVPGGGLAGEALDAQPDLLERGLRVDVALEAEMALARRLVSLGRAARGEAQLKVRQPLAKALVFLPPGSPPILTDVVAEELNVDEVVVARELSEVLHFELVPNFKMLGPRLGAAVKELRPALGRLDAARAAEALEAGRAVEVSLGDRTVQLGPGDVELRVRGQAGFAVSRDGGEVVALDVQLDDDLRRRGMAREVVRQVQELRKASGLEVSDRIRLWLVHVDDLEDHSAYIASEVLATDIAFDGPREGQGYDGEAALELDDGRQAKAFLARL
jgi:isoleucyl-tRNA synthetase